ncbi:4-hydroxy-2-oxo-heptane-1,7-dioate aldolase [Corynebacterium atrinae]|uniref:HpcH/HpaI aldolase family protein n=1 Tax=Corynebacterium atrinae TaxID=1336740 RepID=UPI0025B5EBA0|nr:aldolase/citrate lyase family protein [Corynebacterium atrinae]WJY62298.1 4-hydroxy-2-oxo-heptane-1,7-dioate aldolase [Corynebacterium atrinae]
MPFHLELPPTFPEVIAQRKATQVGLWVCSGSATAAEIVASSGCDWVLVDGEHSPIGLESTLDILRAVGPYPVTPIVRVPANDTVLIKQFLDLGAQNIMVPMVHTVADAEVAVAAMHYPPRGVRGVGSALARSARWNKVPDYLGAASQHVSLTVQVESEESAVNAMDILTVDGVDAVFIGPSDLAASMGLLGQQNHEDVVAHVLNTIKAANVVGTPVGVNAFNNEQAKYYIDAGADFVAVGADVQLLASSTAALAEKFGAYNTKR